MQKEGSPEEGWAITYYVLQLYAPLAVQELMSHCLSSRGMLLFGTIVLIGAGFGFVKHVLSKREKQLIAVVLSLQVCTSIVSVAA